MVNQISENVRMEKKIEIQNNVIRELKEKIQVKETEKPIDMSEDITNIKKEEGELKYIFEIYAL